MKELEAKFAEIRERAEEGNASAMNEFGRLWAMGFPDAPEQNFDEAEKWILKAQAAYATYNAVLAPEVEPYNPADDSLQLMYIDRDGRYYSILSGDPCFQS
jgi:hypothetical protein